MAVPVSIDGKSILTLHSTTVHSKKYTKVSKISISIIPRIYMISGAALAPKMLAPEKSPGIKFCRQFQKVGARKFRCHNLFVQNHSLSSMQILSLMTPALKSWYCCSITGYINTCQKGKLLCLLWSFLLYWTFCLLWGHFHAENETEASSENNNRKFTYSV